MALLLLLGIQQGINAQSTLFQNVPNISVLNASQTQKYQLLSNSGKFSSVQLIQLGALSNNVSSSGNLQINLSNSPFQSECANAQYKQNAIRYIDEQNYYYYGTLIEGDTTSCNCRSGEFMLIAKNGRKYGYFTVDESRYEILSIDANYSIVTKVNAAYFTGKQECVNQFPSNHEIPSPGADEKVNYREENCTIRILFLYTQAAEDEVGLSGIQDMTELGVVQTNQAFYNSLIPDLHLTTANIRKWEFVETEGDFNGDINILINSNQVAQWRQDDLADVVCLITDGNYTNLLGGTGIKPDPNNAGQFISNLGNPMSDLAYMIVEASSFNTKYTFCHEFGHILGCRHQTCAVFDHKGCDDDGAYEHGHAWGEKKGLCWKNYTSLLYQLRDGYTRLLNYSNPDVMHSDHPTGIAEERDNARWIKEGNGCTVAGYLPDPLLPTVQILGDEKLCPPLAETYFADASGSTPPYTYEWHISTNGVNWGAVAGTGVSLLVSSSLYPVNSTVFLRVKVTTALGNSIYAFFQIKIASHSECLGFRQSGNQNNEINIFPNPTVGNIDVEFTLNSDNTPISIQLYTATGILIEEYFNIMNLGDHRLPINTDKLTKGSYFVQLRIGDTMYHQLLIKQ